MDHHDRPIRLGVYDGHRAAALAGVPYSTLQYWAREGVVTPSISPERVRLWAWLDLVKLRAVTCLRKQWGVTMPKVRDALTFIEAEGLGHLPLDQVLLVSKGGGMFVTVNGKTYQVDAGHQMAAREVLNLVSPFGTGPDLRQPRPALRIIPGKVSGEPHVAETRITSLNVYALHCSGYATGDILRLYPDLTAAAIDQAVDLELGLHRPAVGIARRAA